MTVFICVDDRGGMTFMKRRLSRDKILTEDLVKTVGDGILYISEFSESLFSESSLSVMSVSSPLQSAGKDDFVFIENLPLSDALNKIDTLVIYKWNRTYPFDFSLDLNPDKSGFLLVDSYDFKGNSHDKITKEIYKK